MPVAPRRGGAAAARRCCAERGRRRRCWSARKAGFAAAEIEAARAAGFLPVSLGPRILRVETAAIVAVALAEEAFGALSPSRR